MLQDGLILKSSEAQRVPLEERVKMVTKNALAKVARYFSQLLDGKHLSCHGAYIVAVM